MQVHESRVPIRHLCVNTGIYKMVTTEVSSGYHSSMNIREIHISNLKQAIQRCGSIDGLLDAMATKGVDPVSKKYLQNVLNGVQTKGYKRKRDLGHDVCRKIERTLGESDGWMDVRHDGHQSSDSSVEMTLGPREMALLQNFRGMTASQQDEFIRESEKTKQLNESILNELACSVQGRKNVS
ncbi:hypothetical protein [Acidithiobacillus sulfurivorans]|uniref:Uncharacterized protein n=1 Tax=Acidithiobacillus sulfurivorans TaxID=1958756 RepID=A0ABS6A2T8_9PROT|nr:hypothetical protein [Acidithiobacillus sulfurivorans]MBU2761668.1 hypothetical protein [Acidithiobacillus sulfurivorans]